jgi:hypothetical protein
MVAARRRDKMFYATLNVRADLINGSHGFANTWEVARFSSCADRDEWLEANSNRLARAVTRKEACLIFAGQYLCVGDAVPKGGLFGETPYKDSWFWNENQLGSVQ